MKRNTVLAIAVWLFLALSMLLDLVFLNTVYAQTYNLTVTIVLACLILAWAIADSRTIGVKLSPILKACIVAFGVFAVPYYLIRYKGIRRSMISFGKFFAFAGMLFIYVYLIGAIFNV